MEPTPETESLRTVRYTEDEARDTFDRVAWCYFRTMGFMETRVNLQAIAQAAIRPDETVPDVGFGTGWCLKRLVPLTGVRWNRPKGAP
jgi:ubiquinone/menaquinone biosynthesis C-methylase UbiE